MKKIVQSHKERTDGQLSERNSLGVKTEQFYYFKSMISPHLPNNLERLSNSFQDDLLVSELSIEVSVVLLFARLLCCLQDQQLSSFNFKLLTFVSTSALFGWNILILASRVKNGINLDQCQLFLKQNMKKFSWKVIICFVCCFQYQILRQPLLCFQSSHILSIVGIVGIILTIFLFSMHCDPLTHGNTCPVFRGGRIVFKLWQTLVLLSLLFLNCLNLQLLQSNDQISALVSFVVTSQLWGWVCSGLQFLLSANIDISYLSFYTQLNYSQLTKLCIISYYSSGSFISYTYHSSAQMPILLIILLQSSVCLVLMKNWRTKTFYLEVLKKYSERECYFKSKQNYCFKVKDFKLYSQSICLKMKESEYAEDEFCCMCNSHMANVVFKKCMHVCICDTCLKQQQRKAGISKCPICCQEISADLVTLNKRNYPMQLIKNLKVDMKGVSFCSFYFYEQKIED